MRLDVFLDTGVSVTIPDDVDPSTDEGLEQVKAVAREMFLDMLDRGFDIEFEEVAEDMP